MRRALRVIPLLLLPATLASQAAPAPAHPVDWAAIQAQGVEILRQYVRINTSNPPGNELETARFLKAILDKEGIEATILEVRYHVHGHGNAGNGAERERQREPAERRLT